METSIQVSKELLERLRVMKMHDKESYESILWDLMEDRLVLSEEAERNIAKSEREIREGKTVSLAEVKRKLGM